MDLLVKDTSSLSASVTRVKLNLTLERESTYYLFLIFKRELDQEQHDLQDYVNYGFKKDHYYVILKQGDQLVKGNKLLNLYNEFGLCEVQSNFLEQSNFLTEN
jgi:hypothetical protein